MDRKKRERGGKRDTVHCTCMESSFFSSSSSPSLLDICSITSRHDLHKLIISSLDFAHDTHSRAILHKLLTGTDTVRERETKRQERKRQRQRKKKTKKEGTETRQRQRKRERERERERGKLNSCGHNQ